MQDLCQRQRVSLLGNFAWSHAALRVSRDCRSLEVHLHVQSPLLICGDHCDLYLEKVGLSSNIKIGTYLVSIRVMPLIAEILTRASQIMSLPT